jgi:hypothetical protein
LLLKIWEGEDSLTEPTINRSTGLLERLEQRELLRPTAIIGLVGTALIWFLLIEFHSVRDFLFQLPLEGGGKLGYGFTFLRGGLVMAFPFFGALALGHLLMPGIGEDTVPDSEFMSSYHQKDKSEKRWRIVIVAGMFGALNLILMFSLLR